MVKQVLRKADKPRTALKELKKQYSNVNSQYQRMKSDKWQFSDLAASWYDRDRRKIQKKIDAVQKVVDKKTKPNNKDLSKSLWSVASNKWMKKSDVERTITNKQIMLQNAKEDYNDLTRKWKKATPNQDRTKDKTSINLNRITTNNKIKSLEKEIKSIKKTAQKRK